MKQIAYQRQKEDYQTLKNSYYKVNMDKLKGVSIHNCEPKQVLRSIDGVLQTEDDVYYIPTIYLIHNKYSEIVHRLLEYDAVTEVRLTVHESKEDIGTKRLTVLDETNDVHGIKVIGM